MSSGARSRGSVRKCYIYVCWVFAMEGLDQLSPVIRFGTFEVNRRAGELRKQGFKVKLQEQPFQILVILLEKPGEVVTREELQKRLWPADTFVDFDRGLNRAVNKLRSALGDDTGSPRFIETLPRRGYRFIAPVAAAQTGAPVEPAEARPAPPQRMRWFLVAGIVLMVTILFFAGLNVGGIRDRLVGQHAPASIQSIAVLPLTNLSADPAQEYFADGMTDALITEISRIGSLRVISRTSVMRYKVTNKPSPAIAKELGVDALVEGTVLHAGDKVRITAQLVRTRDDRHLWSEKYERSLTDVLALQGEVAQSIAGHIAVQAGSRRQESFTPSRSVNPEAYEAFLEGSYFQRKMTEEGFEKSIELFTKATELDPGFAQGYAGLSLSYCYRGISGLRPAREEYTKARMAATKALELDKTITEAHNVLADVKKGYDWDWPAAEAEYKLALELSPSYSLAHSWYAEYLSKRGRYDEAIAEATRARHLDPVSASSNTLLGMVLYRARRYDEAIVACERALEFAPNHPTALWFLALAHQQQHQLSRAITEFNQALTASGGAAIYMGLLGQAYAVAGDRQKALRILEDLEVLARTKYVSPLDVAIVYTGLGDRNSAFQWLEKAYQQRVMRIQELPDPIFDSLRSDARFGDLIRRIGLQLPEVHQ
jgi:TolB-like protein/DNA-binding winged helix-turn-helix (wHTH) protein/Tfp pilus assembly protein PilF